MDRHGLAEAAQGIASVGAEVTVLEVCVEGAGEPFLTGVLLTLCDRNI